MTLREAQGSGVRLLGYWLKGDREKEGKREGGKREEERERVDRKREERKEGEKVAANLFCSQKQEIFATHMCGSQMLFGAAFPGSN